MVSKLRVEGAESEGEVNLVVGSNSKLTESSELDQSRMGFITSSQVVPVAQCDDHTHRCWHIVIHSVTSSQVPV